MASLCDCGKTSTIKKGVQIGPRPRRLNYVLKLGRHKLRLRRNGLAPELFRGQSILSNLAPPRVPADRAGAEVGPKELEVGIPVVVCEPTLDAPDFFRFEVMHDLEAFKARCGVIVVNRWSDDLFGVVDKVYTRALFKRE